LKKLESRRDEPSDPFKSVIRVGDFVRLRWGNPEEKARIYEVATVGERYRSPGKLEAAALDSAGKGYPFSQLEVVARKR
jgi:hypothetical protein